MRGRGRIKEQWNQGDWNQGTQKIKKGTLLIRESGIVVANEQNEIFRRKEGGRSHNELKCSPGELPENSQNQRTGWNFRGNGIPFTVPSSLSYRCCTLPFLSLSSPTTVILHHLSLSLSSAFTLNRFTFSTDTLFHVTFFPLWVCLEKEADKTLSPFQLSFSKPGRKSGAVIPKKCIQHTLIHLSIISWMCRSNETLC